MKEIFISFFFNSEFQTFKVAFFQTVKLEFPNLIFLLSKIPNLKFEFSRLKLKIPTSKLKNQMKVGNSKNWIFKFKNWKNQL